MGKKVDRMCKTWAWNGLQPSQNDGKKTSNLWGITLEASKVHQAVITFLRSLGVATSGHHRATDFIVAVGLDEPLLCAGVVVLAWIHPVSFPCSCAFPSCPEKGKHSGGHWKKKLTALRGYIQPSGHKQTGLVYSGDICIKCSLTGHMLQINHAFTPQTRPWFLIAEPPFWSSRNLWTRW